MLFHVTWKATVFDEEAEQRSLTLFEQWEAPEGAHFVGFYANVGGDGGVAIIDSDDAAALARTIAPWTPFFEFSVTPIIPIEESAAIGGEAVAWRASIA
jgi:hypothetical protein